MSINSGIKKQKKYIADENGNHTLTSLWTSTDTVEDSVGNTLTSILAQIGDPTVTVVASEESGIAKRYTIYQGGTAVSVPIDIPLDMVIQSGSLVDITFHDDKLWDGATDVTALIMPAGQTPTSANAGKYIKLVIANSSGDVIYISLLDLTFSDENVKQNYVTDAEIVRPLLLAGSEDAQTKTEDTSKSPTLKFNTKGSHLMVTDLSTPSKYIDIKPDDVTLNGSGNTWDGTNTSLKTALSSAGSDANVAQTPASDNSNYEILFSGTADNTAHTEGAKKSDGLKYNPNYKYLSVGTTRIISSVPSVLVGKMTSGGGGQPATYKTLSVGSDDITILEGGTWDGTNTSLKDALASAGTDANVLQSNSTYVGTTSHPLLLSSGTGSDVTNKTYVPNYIAYEEIPDTVSDTGYAYSMLTLVDDEDSSIQITPYDITSSQTLGMINGDSYNSYGEFMHDLGYYVTDAIGIDPNRGRYFQGGLETGYLAITDKTIEGGRLYANIMPNSAEVSVGDKTTPSGSQVVHTYTSLQPSEIDVIRNYTDTQGNAYTKSLTIDATDIVLYGDGAIGNTWDGTNTSLKAAIASAGGGGGYTDVTGTLTAGNTSITLSDSSITTSSTLDYYTDTFGVNPTNVSVSTGSVTLTFEAQQSNLGVKVRVS